MNSRPALQSRPGVKLIKFVRLTVLRVGRFTLLSITSVILTGIPLLLAAGLVHWARGPENFVKLGMLFSPAYRALGAALARM